LSQFEEGNIAVQGDQTTTALPNDEEDFIHFDLISDYIPITGDSPELGFFLSF
jgi:hypothetical protein